MLKPGKMYRNQTGFAIRKTSCYVWVGENELFLVVKVLWKKEEDTYPEFLVLHQNGLEIFHLVEYGNFEELVKER